MKRPIACFFAIGFGIALLVAMQRASAPVAFADEPPRTAEGFLILPDDFLDGFNVPHDAPQGSDATLSELGQFAWREFIALCWPAIPPTAANKERAKPDETKPFTVTNPMLLVWETYQHKAEMFPYQGSGNPLPPPVPPNSFDTFPPVYKYKPSLTIRPADPENPIRTQWNNLDESTEISRCTLYAHSTANEVNKNFRILYEAKVNRVFYNYIVSKKLYALAVREKVIRFGTDSGFGTFDLLRYGSRTDLSKPILRSTSKTILVQFPAGFAGMGTEGAIEVKPAWRRLTPEERESGRFYTNTVQFYENEELPERLQVKNETFGLIGLHIIQKTESFPSFAYATWEQVDNPSSGLHYENAITPDGGEFPVERKHGIPSAINAVNIAVHRMIKARNTKSVWQYYRLIGVQANATNPPGPEATHDEISSFNLANLVVETNEELQSFAGTLNGTENRNLPRLNTFRLGRSFNAGGCLGCHGAQGQLRGYDFSVIAAKGPVKEPEAINEGKEKMMNLMRSLLGINQPETN